MPPLVSDSDIRDELSIFPGIERDPYYADIVRVSSFLSNRDAVVEALKHLEQRIKDKGRAAWHMTRDFQERSEFLQESDIPFSSLETSLEGMLLRHFDPIGRPPSEPFTPSLDYEALGEKLGFEPMPPLDLPVLELPLLGLGAPPDPTEGAKKDFLKHLFSSTLTDLEIAEKFDVSQGGMLPPKSQYYLGIVDPDLFRDQIRRGRPQGKDPFVDANHGEYTHRLQWYAVMSPTSRVGLLNPVVEVYQAVGHYAAPEGTYGKTFRWGLWDALCDRDNGTAAVVPFKAVNDRDCRCPNCLHTFLKDEGLHHGLPLISAFLKGRFDKRTLQHKDPMDYAARKVFGRPLKRLHPKETEILFKQLNSFQAVWDREKGWR